MCKTWTRLIIVVQSEHKVQWPVRAHLPSWSDGCGLTPKPWSLHPKKNTNKQASSSLSVIKRFCCHKFLMMGMHSFPICPPSTKLYYLHRKIMSLSTLHYYEEGKCGRAPSRWQNRLVIITSTTSQGWKGLLTSQGTPLSAVAQNSLLSFKSRKKQYQERQHHSKVWMAKLWKTYLCKNNPNRLSKSYCPRQTDV